jgi:hypothetical protein
LKLKCDIMLSTFAFKFNLRRYKEALMSFANVYANFYKSHKVGRVTGYPISIWRMTISILSSPIS